MVTVYNNETNQTNSSAYYCRFDDSFKYILLPVSYTLVFVIGLALNATALYVIVFRTKRWKPSTIYMFNLTVCDTLYIFTLPFLIFYYADKNDWPFSEPFCKFIRFLFYANLYGSILFLSCISLHRFVGICYPVRSLSWVSVRQARLVSVVVWTCVLFCQAPVLYFSRTSLMVRKLLEPGWGFEGRTEEERGGLTAQRFKQKSVKMIIIVLAAFMLCFLPFHLTRSLHYIFRYLRQVNPAQISCNLLNSSNVAYKITRPLASANSCVDPILYFLAGQDARSNFPKRCKLQSPKAKTGSQNLTTKL
ncbi:P2Y purinoceptor 2 isoform X2 [Archocentrus centrarchus]|uniref:P2Y purinoceptor 2 isoform X2 n=1 Tax=Archocentrus centrarchus TaxID=63155 RepID=UPI0011E9BA28|nr:P2Y purinoceptor 2 isoform X2 [Archocentrus centrarchus]